MLNINKGYEIMGLVLNQDQMREVKNYYQVALLQQYVVENYQISEEDALKVAELAYEIEEEAMVNDYNVQEQESIWEASEELGIELKEQEDLQY